MYNIIPLILMLISLGTIIVIVFRKFAVLASLDIETIQAEREATMKERIISNRLKRNYFKYYSRLIRILRPLGAGIGNFFKWSYEKLVEFKNNYNKEEMKTADDGEANNKLYIEALELMKGEEYDEAEKKLINIIGIDSKNIKAFRSLGELYYERKDFHEGRQTLEHAARLLEKDLETISLGQSGKEDIGEQNKDELSRQLADTYFELTQVCKAIESFKDSINFIDKALKIQPNNPRYLDIKLEISIIMEDKGNAILTLDKLKEADPDNQKLDELKEEIDNI